MVERKAPERCAEDRLRREAWLITGKTEAAARFGITKEVENPLRGEESE